MAGQRGIGIWFIRPEVQRRRYLETSPFFMGGEGLRQWLLLVSRKFLHLGSLFLSSPLASSSGLRTEQYSVLTGSKDCSMKIWSLANGQFRLLFAFLHSFNACLPLLQKNLTRCDFNVGVGWGVRRRSRRKRRQVRPSSLNLNGEYDRCEHIVGQITIIKQ